MLAAGAALLAGATVFAASQPVAVQAVQRKFEEAYRQGDWSRAIEAGRELASMVPKRPEVQYNLACVYARAGDADSAFDWLGEAATSGFRDLAHMEADRDLESLRNLPPYRKIRSMVEANLRRRESQLAATAAASPVLLVPPRGYDPSRPSPLLVVFHGFGDQPANYPYLLGLVADTQGAVLAVPRGGREVGKGFGWTGVDEAEAVLGRVLERACQEFLIDRERVVLTGFSQGAFMALVLGARHPDLVRGVVPIAGAYMPEIDAPAPAGAGAPRYFFISGSQDRAVTDMRRAARDFEAAGYDTRFRILPGLGHVFPDRDSRELREAVRWVLAR
jgi:predicted esterase